MSTARTAAWDALQAIDTFRGTAWSTAADVSSTRSTTWDVLQAIETIRATAWGVLNLADVLTPDRLSAELYARDLDQATLAAATVSATTRAAAIAAQLREEP